MTNYEFLAFEESRIHVQNLLKAVEIAKVYHDELRKKCDHRYPDGKSSMCYHFCQICGIEHNDL